MPTVTVSNAGGNWTAGATWVGGVAPTSADDVVFTITSGNLVVNSTTLCVCKSIDTTGWLGTLSGTGHIIVSGNVKFTVGITITMTGDISPAASGTWTSAGITFTGGIRPNAPATITLADNWTVNGSFNHAASGGAFVMNGNTLNFKGTAWTQSSGRTISGTTVITAAGTSGTSTFTCSATFGNALVINSSNIILMQTWVQSGGSITHTASSSISSNALCTCIGAVTLNCAAISWSSFTFSTSTPTLSAALNVTGQFSISGNTTFSGAFDVNCGSALIGFTTVLSGNINSAAGVTYNSTTTIVNGAFTVNIGTSLVLNSSSVIVTGTATHKMIGTGNITGAGGTSAFKSNLTINTAGNITISTANPFVFNTSTFLITAVGSLITTGSTLTLGGTLTVNQAGLTFGIVNCNLTTTINGTSGFSMAQFTDTVAGTIVTWKNTNTYNISTNTTITGTAASKVQMLSSSGGSQANIILAAAATQSVSHVTATDINSATGQTFWVFDPTLSNTVNWNSLTASAMQRSASYAG